MMLNASSKTFHQHLNVADDRHGAPSSFWLSASLGMSVNEVHSSSLTLDYVAG
jgi:hypothetical protein